MAPPVDIPFPGIHPRVGEQVLTVDPGVYPIRPSDGFPAAAYAALVFWPRTYGNWLTVQAELDTGGRFNGSPKDLIDALQRHKVEHTALAQEVANEEWVMAHHFLVGSVPAGAGVRLRVGVDTNNKKFLDAVQDPPDDGLPVPISIVYFDATAPQADGQTVRFILHPATPVRASRALMALDVGNTSTSAAMLDPWERDGDPRPLTHRIPMLGARPVPGRGGSIGFADPKAAPIPSELRFTQFRTWYPAGTQLPNTRVFPDLLLFPDDDLPNAVDYFAGELARAAGVSARSVMIGAKRMAASRPKAKDPRNPTGQTDFPTYPVTAPHRLIPEPTGETTDLPNATIQVDVRGPLELLAARLFQHFREARKEWPLKVALTYPTTYSRYELQSLRRAVQKGWLRMQALRQQPGRDIPGNDRELNEVGRQLQAVVSGPMDLDTQSRDPVIQLLLDEASAAAFFFLHRKIFEEIDGGLAAFRYLYEHGLNMLLYDCGGGTTDIALVKAVVEPDVRTLRITVLRRSGVRTFGGDDITRQVCRLLKAKLQYQIALDRKKPLQTAPPITPVKPPTDPAGWKALAAELEKFIADMSAADSQDLLVPTKTPPGQAPTEDRRAASLDLWRMGEQMKYTLSQEKTPTGPQSATFTPGEARLPPLERDTNTLTRAVLPADPQQLAQFKRKLETVSVNRIEIDALVYEPIMRSIANCNKLIADVFESRLGADEMPEEVHWVVASGNAVRYPAIQQALRRHLAVPFLDDPSRFTFDPDNAKDATAKGAVLALAAMEAQAEQIDPKFDSDLADRLPFDVGFRDLRVGMVKVLFEEHKRYLDLKTREPVKILLAEVSKQGVTAKRFVLLRRFPGDTGFTNFLAFEFPDGIQGPHLSVLYDDESEFEFRVLDGAGNEGAAVDLTAGDTYQAPAQRGDI